MKTHQSTFQAQTIFYLINYIWLIIQRVKIHLSIYISNDLFFIERARLAPPIFHAKSYYSNFSCPLEHKRRRISRSHRLLRRESERNLFSPISTYPSIFSLRPQGLSMDQPLSLPPQTRIVVTNRDIPPHPRPRNERVRIQKPVYPTEEIWLRVVHGEEERGVKRKSTMVKLKHGCRWKTNVQLRDLSKTVDSMGGYIMGRVCFVVSDYHFTLFVLV